MYRLQFSYPKIINWDTSGPLREIETSSEMIYAGLEVYL